MPNILFIETASDQANILHDFRSAAISADLDAHFLFKNKRQLNFYEQNVIDGYFLK